MTPHHHHMKPPSGEDFLKKKYDLHASPEAEEQAERTEFLKGEKVPQEPAARISNYLKRFEDILEREDPEHRERGVEALKRVLRKRHVIKPDEIPQNYYDLQGRIAEERGQRTELEQAGIRIEEEKDEKGRTRKHYQYPEKLKRELQEAVITDQESSLDTWVDYFASDDAKFYPTWLKYWATREVLKMGGYDKEKHAFAKRRKDTVKPFPDLNREALAYVLDAMGKKVKGEPTEDDPDFQKVLDTESFPKLYAHAIEKVTPASKEQLEKVEGEWKRYPKGSDHMALARSLQGHGTGWCTAGESTAEAQLQAGDFWVFYSKDDKGNNTVPRAAIRMEGDKIAEVRGVGADQNLDPHIAPVVQDKLQEFPDGPKYEKKASDMKVLTKIERKMDAGEPLGKDELKFLYEIDSKIEGFGYSKDPRIEELRSRRNPMEDAPVVLECGPDQIATRPEDVTPDAKAYIGPLFPRDSARGRPGIFEHDNLEHIYTSFPEGRIERVTLELGGKTPEEYEDELESEGHRLNQRSKDILKKMPVSKETQEIELVRLKVRDLFGDQNMHEYQDIQKRAKGLGLDLAPAESGPALRLKMKDQPMGDWVLIGMEAITGRDGYPDVFDVYRREDGSWLGNGSGNPDSRWDPEDSFAFAARKH